LLKDLLKWLTNLKGDIADLKTSKDFKRFQQISRDFKRLQKTSRDFMRLHETSRDF
jgi:hypothetical protein